jgi:beta-mannosidase
MGSLYWQLNDCWPVASWASIDSFGRWKALQYAARRFFASVLVTSAEERGEVVVHVVSDRTAALVGVLEARLLDLEGTTLWEQRQEWTVEPLASRRALAVPRTTLLRGRDPGAVFLNVRLTAGGETLSNHNRFFVPPKDMKLKGPRIETRVARGDGGFVVVLGSDTLARHVRLTCPADDGFFDDNYFDLVPGEPAQVHFRPQGEVDLEAFRTGLVVESIVDALGARGRAPEKK